MQLTAVSTDISERDIQQTSHWFHIIIIVIFVLFTLKVCSILLVFRCTVLSPVKYLICLECVEPKRIHPVLSFGQLLGPPSTSLQTLVLVPLVGPGVSVLIWGPWTWQSHYSSLLLHWDHLGIPRKKEEEVVAEKDIFLDLLIYLKDQCVTFNGVFSG